MSITKRHSEFVQAQVEGLVQSGVHVSEFAAQLVSLLELAIPHDAACIVTIDPATTLLTGSYKFGLLANAHENDELWAQLEYGSDDPTRMCQIAKLAVPAMATSQLPGGPTDSVRMNELVIPGGFSDELRMVALDGEDVWGGVNLFRADGTEPFSMDEIALLGIMSATIAAGLQAGLMSRETEVWSGPSHVGPAVLFVGRDAELKQTSYGADVLLDHLTDEVNRSPATAIIRGLVERAKQYASGEGQSIARARLRTPSGKWLIAHGAPLATQDEPSGDVIVMIDEARSAEVVSLVSATFGFTNRESEVAELAIQGLDTKAIATALYISPYTVQDHLKAIFDKAGVRSRRELMAKVFYDQFGPQPQIDGDKNVT